MRSLTLLMFLTAFFFSSCTIQAEEEKTSEEDNKIIALVLNSFTNNDRYANLEGFRQRYYVVYPETLIASDFLRQDPAEYKKTSRYKFLVSMPGGLSEENSKLLIDAFLEKNETTSTISLESNLAKGYIIDREKKHFHKGHQERPSMGYKVPSDADKGKPENMGTAVISKPFYDKKAGIIVIYVGKDFGPHIPYGTISLYKYQDGKLLGASRGLAIE